MYLEVNLLTEVKFILDNIILKGQTFKSVHQLSTDRSPLSLY